MGTIKKRDHADFQSKYRQSSNSDYSDTDKGYGIDEDGELKLDSDKKDDNTLDETDKKKIADAMNSFKERTEQTPGGEQSDEDSKS